VTSLAVPLDPREIDCVFLDVDGTIVHEDAHVLVSVCWQIARSGGETYTAAEIGAKWSEGWFGLCEISNEEEYAPCRELLPRSLQATLDHFGIEFEMEPWIRAVIEYSRRSPVTHDAWAFLDEVGIPVCLLTNRDSGPLRETLERGRIQAAGVITSEDVRAYKPHPAMFRAALETMGASPERVVHIGDSHHADVCGAARVGLQTVWLNRANEPAPIAEGIRADRVVRSLLELLPPSVA
jgi:2-haloacid dehalogenase/putative hydrolase of the HAD superfamily